MRTDLVPAEEARAIIMRGAAPLGIEDLPIGQAGDRVLASDLVALRTQPGFAASAMDGYALRQADLTGNSRRLKVVGTAAAGHPFGSPVGPGEAVRIFTGAPVPAGADTIVIQENAEADNGAVTILKSAPAGRFIRRAGLDFTRGERLLRAGDVLDAPRLALAAAMNHPHVPVWRKPVVALMATGDELVLPGAEPSPSQIIASNTFGLSAIIAGAGGRVLDIGIVPDTRENLGSAIGRALAEGADVIVSSGGASVGDHDLVRPVYESMGATFDLCRIAMRPGKPLLAGRIAHDGRMVRILGLAGNPVSSIIGALIFARPLVAALAGRPPGDMRAEDAVLGGDLAANDEREEYMRAHLARDDHGRTVVTAFEGQDSAMLAGLAAADALIVRAANAPPARRGDPCRIIRLRR